MRSTFHRIVSFVVILGLKAFTLVTNRPRARVLVVNEKGQVLLIRAVISHGKWTLPGGGLERHEQAVTAARRELQEETGIVADESAFEYITTLGKPEHDIPFLAPLFRLRVGSAALPEQPVNAREIEGIGWFDRDNLPEPLSRTVTIALELDH